jgi:hypothetical protein
MPRPLWDRALVVAICVAWVAAAAAPAPAAKALRLDDRMMGVVASIADAGMRVSCVPPTSGPYEVLARVDWNRRVIQLEPILCRRLNGLAASPASPYTHASYTQAQALLVLVHESVHLSSYTGRRDEALTECRAIQFVHDAGLALGFDDATARALGHDRLLQGRPARHPSRVGRLAELATSELGAGRRRG